MASLPIGRYVAYDSWLHKLDPRAKVFGSLALMVCLFLQYSSICMTFSMLGLMVIIVGILLVASHIGFRRFISSFTMFWITAIFLVLIYILIPRSNPMLPPAWNLNGWVVYYDSFTEAAKILLRLFLMLEISLVLTSTTKPLDLTFAFEWYMTPLKKIGFPASEVAMTLSIALRFIPTLLEDASRVMKAQASRGVDFEHGGLWKKIRGITALIIPLFVSSFIRSEELANAMECRSYNPREERTRYRVLKWKIGDTFAVIFILCLLGGFAYLRATQLNVFAFFIEGAL